jgi:hypothetical protein
MASPDAYPCRREVPWRVLDTETLVVDVKGGMLYPLNAVATRIWQLCDGTRSVEAIGRALIDEFEAGEATVRADVDRFIGELEAAGLLTLEPGPRATAAPEGG